MDETNAWGEDDSMLTSSFAQRGGSKKTPQLHSAKQTIRMIPANGGQFNQDSEWSVVGPKKQGRNNRKVSSQNRKSEPSASAWGVGSFAEKVTKPSTKRSQADPQHRSKNKPPLLIKKKSGGWLTPQQRAINLRAIQSDEQKKVKKSSKYPRVIAKTTINARH